MSDTWEFRERDGVPVLTCGLLRDVPGMAHGFSLRRASGEPRFDCGSGGDESDAAHQRRRRFLRAAGVAESEPVRLIQVHGARVVLARRGPPVQADGAFWSARGGSDAAPAVRTADCVPIVLADRAGSAFAVLHAGWRGTAAGIARRGLEAFAAAGIAPDDLLAAFGPAILGCCYEVEDEVLERVRRASGGEGGLAHPSRRAGRAHLDLHAANLRQLVDGGVPPTHVSAAPYCTCCRDDLFFSHRREGKAAGRHLAVAGPARRP